MLNIISLGAGVQSSTMALMAAHGEITPMPDCAIFADTGAEPKAVYEWLDWLEKQLPFPIHRVKQGNLEEHSMTAHLSKKSGKRYVKSIIPFYIKAPDGSSGIAMRKCTTDYKITPITRKVKELCGIGNGRLPTETLCRSWIGISADEAHRMKPARVPYIKNIWPLIEHNISRNTCLKWMRGKGYPVPPRSACVFCPYHNQAEWKRLKTQDPDSFAHAVAFEKRMQQTYVEKDEVLRGVPYLFSGLIPLDEAVFDDDGAQADMFGNECEGMCGV